MNRDISFREKQDKYWNRKQLDKRRSPDHPVIVEYTNSKIAEIRKCIDIEPNDKLLDVGCGNGFFSVQFDKLCHVTAIDASETMISLNPITDKHVMNAESLNFDDNSFDIIFCHAMLHHVVDIKKIINEMKRVSRRYIVLIEPNRLNPLMFLFGLLVKEERKLLKFSLRYMEEFTRESGLKILDSYSHGILVPNKTPTILIPLLKHLDFRNPFGMTNFVIAEKTN